MRILHLSDLHFGTETPGLLADIKTHISDVPADLAIISGDFTQTAVKREFINARQFIKDLGMPVLCVPGNHDLPRYNLFERFFNPYKRYREFITPDLSPVVKQDNICIAGINTARRVLPHWNWANGAVSWTQLEKLDAHFSENLNGVNICVMHHPIHKAENNPLKTVVFGGETALHALMGMKVDLVLTGHVHHASITTVEDEAGQRTIFLSASTALSTRLRNTANGYNVITVNGNTLGIEIFSYENGRFECRERFEHQVKG